jgi:CHASE3 domain sensor protein
MLQLIKTKISFKTGIILAASISSLLTFLILLSVFLNVNKMIDIQRKTSQSQNYISRLNQIQGYMIDMETGERGFLISGEEYYLEPFNKAEVEFDLFVEETRKALGNNPFQIEKLAEIKKKKEAWIEGPAITEMMTKRKEKAGKVSRDQFTDIFKSVKGKEYTDEIRNLVNLALKAENKILNQLQVDNLSLAQAIRWGSVFVVFSMIFGLFLIVFATEIVAKQLESRWEN